MTCAMSRWLAGGLKKYTDGPKIVLSETRATTARVTSARERKQPIPRLILKIQLEEKGGFFITAYLVLS
jgi:hypothetical protein